MQQSIGQKACSEQNAANEPKSDVAELIKVLENIRARYHPRICHIMDGVSRNDRAALPHLEPNHLAIVGIRYEQIIYEFFALGVDVSKPTVTFSSRSPPLCHALASCTFTTETPVSKASCAIASARSFGVFTWTDLILHQGKIRCTKRL